MKKKILLSLLLLVCFAAPIVSVWTVEEKASKLTDEVLSETYPVVIFGGGIGALTSALYLARAGIQPLIIEGERPGGLLTQSHAVQNWPGESEIEGRVLMDRVRAQVEENGGIFLQEKVVHVDFSSRPFQVKTSALNSGEKGSVVLADACIVAIGTTPNFLGVPGEMEYWGRGVTNCAICDGSLYRGGVVGVVGGGDAAVLEALYLSNIAKEVHMFVRKGQLKATETKRIQALLQKDNVKLHYNTEISQIQGNEKQLTGVVLKTKSEEFPFFPLDGLFLAIGSIPNSDLFKKSLKLDERGYIVLQKDQETSVNGVYAVGDIVDPVYKQAISAAGDGAKAALQAQKFLMDRSSNGTSVKKEKIKSMPRLRQFCASNPCASSTDRSIAEEGETEIHAASSAIDDARKLASKFKFTKPMQVRNKLDSESKVVEILSIEQFKKEMENTDSTVIVDFYASWCSPCKQISTRFESSAHSLYGKVKFLKVNIDQVADLTKLHKVLTLPTVLVFDPSGEVVDRKVGVEEIFGYLKQLDCELAY